MQIRMVQKTKKQQKISVGTFRARTDNRQIFPSGPFSQSGSHICITKKEAGFLMNLVLVKILEGDDAKISSIRAQAFDDRYPSYDAIFHEVVNLNPMLFKNALLFYIDVTYRLSRS